MSILGRVLNAFRAVQARTVGILFADQPQVIRGFFLESPASIPAIEAFELGDYEGAFRRFQEAANRGDPASQLNLGICYESGVGVKNIDDRAAERWYRAAANRGLGIAQYHVAQIVAADVMLDTDAFGRSERVARLREGLMWCLLAAKHGSTEGRVGARRLRAYPRTLC